MPDLVSAVAAVAAGAWRLAVVLHHSKQSVLALQGNELYWQRNRSPGLMRGDGEVQFN